MTSIVATAVLTGLLLAAIAGCLGSVVQWRRMAFFSDALAHSSLLGVGLSVIAGVNLLAGLAVVVALLVALLHFGDSRRLPPDSLLAMFAYLALAGGTVLLYSSGARVNWETLLFGSILAATPEQLYMVVGAAALIAVGFWLLWPALLAMAINPEVAAIEQAAGRRANLLFSLMLCLYVIVGVRLIGVLLLNALLVIPAAAAHNLARSPAQMVASACAIGCASILAGIGASFVWDVPAAPACVLFTGLAFGATWLARSVRSGVR